MESEAGSDSEAADTNVDEDDGSSMDWAKHVMDRSNSFLDLHAIFSVKIFEFFVSFRMFLGVFNCLRMISNVFRYFPGVGCFSHFGSLFHLVFKFSLENYKPSIHLLFLFLFRISKFTWLGLET